MKRKLSLDQLQVKSFITNANIASNLRGGTNNNNNGDQSYVVPCQVTLGEDCENSEPTENCTVRCLITDGCFPTDHFCGQ